MPPGSKPATRICGFNGAGVEALAAPKTRPEDDAHYPARPPFCSCCMLGLDLLSERIRKDGGRFQEARNGPA